MDQFCFGKNQWGLGVLNLDRMNTLLAKWYFVFKDPVGKWKEILRDKYGPSRLAINRCSSFWSGILSLKHIVELGINKTIGNG